ncbi:helix-turn-helix transcriptional regulator [Phenylobacterium sp.]|uniref:helix-turn-helix transcriptional regulator n=1 Tax=Phenylobacterium sp. TaxID=1871053 RepID=UPI0035B238F9
MLPVSVNAEAAVTVETMLARWVDRETRARLVVDEHLTVYWLSSSAQEFLRRDASIVHRNGRLTSRDARTDQALRRFVARATERLSSDCITNHETDEHVVLTAVRLERPWRHVVGLTLHHAGPGFDFALADLGQAFGLTRSERQVATQLLHGRTAEEAARALNVTVDTIRMHIKRAYCKLGVGSREAFFRKLAPFVLPG